MHVCMHACMYVCTYVCKYVCTLLAIKDIFKTLPSSGINNYIKIRKHSVLGKQQ